MNTDTVLIDDDDVDMVQNLHIDSGKEPVVIIDEDDAKTNSELTNVATVDNMDTIVLDDEPETTKSTHTNNNNNDVIIIDDTDKKSLTISETAFINNLKNNRLMDKIITRCLKMGSCVGMPRVINKTLLPLYRDADVKLKESELFRQLLKKTYKLLVRDPDHKFLHIKTLCEELKSGTCRRKVPFVTLATNLKHNGVQWDHNIDISSSSRTTHVNAEVNCRNIVFNENNYQENNCDRDAIGDSEKNNRFTSTFNKTTQANKARANIRNNKKIRKPCTPKKRKPRAIRTCRKVINKKRKEDTSCTVKENEKTDVVIDLDNSDNECVNNENSRNDIVLPASQVVEPAPSENGSDNSNKENNNLENNKDKLSSNEMDYEYLIPQNYVEVVYNDDVPNIPAKVLEIEKEIAVYKEHIAKLETAEVTSDSPVYSQYLQCSKYKRKIVECYKKICELTGDCEDLVKRREIRLRVVEGHPPGPAKRLEQFLNLSIDNKTGAVSFPDFTDVVECVFRANFEDKLGWDKHRVFQEAVTLFRECGQALRECRQKREYRDLLSLVQDKELTDDPAEKDPLLLAKLEENKQIARVKEDQILERYVSMEKKSSACLTPRLVALETCQNSSDSDSDTELNLPPANKSAIHATSTTVETQSKLGESSKINEVICNTTGHLEQSISQSIMNQTVLIVNGPRTFTAIPTHSEIRQSLESNEAICNSKSFEDKGKSKVLVVNGSCSLNDIRNYVSCASDAEQNRDSRTNETEEAKVKTELEIKNEPLDIQSMLDELGDNFVSTVFDIEDPFLVIEISSDGFSDDGS